MFYSDPSVLLAAQDAVDAWSTVRGEQPIVVVAARANEDGSATARDVNGNERSFSGARAAVVADAIRRCQSALLQ